jgi:hypothetical protein
MQSHLGNFDIGNCKVGVCLGVCFMWLNECDSELAREQTLKSMVVSVSIGVGP